MCGIIGIIGAKAEPVAAELYDGLVHLQHRGQDACGIMTANQRFFSKMGRGLVRETFTEKEIAGLTGSMGIAHARYPTAGGYSDDEIQPFWIGSPFGIAFAHNGNLVNHRELANELRAQHWHLNSDSDSEVLMHLFAEGLSTDKNDLDDDAFFELLCHAVKEIHRSAIGAYSVISMIIGKGLVAFRDPHGIRPLVMATREENGKADHLFASEPTMLSSLGFKTAGDVHAGELVFISQKTKKVYRKILTKADFTPCMFEYVYFARPDALLDDVGVYRARLRLGQNLAKHWQEKHGNEVPDVVIPAPFTANTAALSFAQTLNVRYSEGLYKNPFIGRTFIMPSTKQRKRSVRHKLIPQHTEINGKTVMIIDDSIVRGTTSREIVRMVKECGAKAVYFGSTCPPIKFPCFYGIDMPTRKELIANDKSPEEMERYLGVDKLIYQQMPGLAEAITRVGHHGISKPCMACLNGRYVTGDINEQKIEELEKKR